MPFSHHSHSGQFCPGHAKDSLEEVIQTAISKKMQVFCLTEHMPREEVDFYPEEIEAGQTEAWHSTNEEAYFTEALRLRKKYSSQISIIIGFECDWIRPSSQTVIARSLSRFPFEFFIGSVHHMHTIPIDYDHEMYIRARDIAGGTDERLFEDYFDAQLDMLKALKPPVVGHFDLIRLKSDDPERSFKTWPGVWERVVRNLEFVVGYGGLVEVNGAALRKGMSEPYPKGEICEELLALGGRLCLSDDSHGVDQVSLNFHRVLEFLDRLGVDKLHYLSLVGEEGGDLSAAPDERFPRTRVAAVSMEEVKQMAFWKV
ncbi:uncharacterized protein N7473_007035 [Penicillium subrubescens]|uniref:Histidinol-phosphatase n=1 Tax=Penicillium subrubescens TaxID=1316194 RepID=A0A1Q5TG73_9EURO|nr:uncharacterized protein N7473_007035 [Penicillium subrubescens]KAJ5890807.1 hypothetical protein N7473_007035 [Penicillium subrubescens]OKO99238.1 hypothetical protein PENSUB_8625 [Penicillium subrubescens]